MKKLLAPIYLLSSVCSSGFAMTAEDAANSLLAGTSLSCSTTSMAHIETFGNTQTAHQNITRLFESVPAPERKELIRQINELLSVMDGFCLVFYQTQSSKFSILSAGHKKQLILKALLSIDQSK